MSHHHMLTPIVYAPETKPKKTEPKKSRIQMHGAGSLDGAGEAGETFELGPPAGRPAPNFRCKILCRSKAPNKNRISRRDASAKAL